MAKLAVIWREGWRWKAWFHILIFIKHACLTQPGSNKKMARREIAEMENIRRAWREKIFQPDFRDKTYTEQGKELGVSAQTISNWRQEINPARWQQILDMTRKESAGPTLEIDDALRRAAKGGDVSAIKLWYEIHGWSPKQNLEISRVDKELDEKGTFELMKELFKGLSAEQRAELVREGGSGAIEANVERLEGPVEGGSQ